MNNYDIVYNREIKEKLSFLNEKETALSAHIEELESKSIEITEIEKRIVAIKQKYADVKSEKDTLNQKIT